MRVLYIGGTGEISYECVKLGVELGQQVTVFNRGKRPAKLPEGVEEVTGDLNDDAAVAAMADRKFDAVCQFIAFGMPRIEKDIELFAGKCGQYVFISSASAYQKPPTTHVITESTPLINPHWQYSRNKAEIEAHLMRTHESGRMNVTIVRPSHTYRAHIPVAFGNGHHVVWRMFHGKPVIVHGDGESLWTMTHSADFARFFVRLLGNPKAGGEAFHITAEFQYTWNRIYQILGQTIGVEPDLRYLTSRRIVAIDPRAEGSLLGDKTISVVFDNSKVKAAVGGGVECSIGLEAGFARMWNEHCRKQHENYEPKPEDEELMDRMAAEAD